MTLKIYLTNRRIRTVTGNPSKTELIAAKFRKSIASSICRASPDQTQTREDVRKHDNPIDPAFPLGSLP